jgi:phosphate transport system substrate-binding protein
MKTSVILLVLFVSSQAWSQVSVTKLTVKGSTALRPLIVDLSPSYASKNNLIIPYIDAGSLEGYQCILDKSCDIGTATVALSAEQKSKVNAIQIAWDGVSVVVSKGVAVDDLSPEQIRKILTGEITNWKDVGGQDMPIKVFAREPGRGASVLLEKEFKIKNIIGKQLGTTEAVPNHLKSFPGSISYMSTGLVSSIGGGNIKEVAISGVKPTNEAIKSGKYPLRREAFIIVAKAPTKEASAFAKFIQEKSPELLNKFGMLPP